MRARACAGDSGHYEEEVRAMKVLVAYASKHDATADIADAIGRTLSERGIGTAVSSVERRLRTSMASTRSCSGAPSMSGKWLEPARHFVDEHADELATRPTWLFSSGPIGDPPRPTAEDAVQIEGDRRADTGSRAPPVRRPARQEQRSASASERSRSPSESPTATFATGTRSHSWAMRIADALEQPPTAVRPGVAQARAE